MNLVFLGPPGAGKGTQAAKVCEEFCIPHISTGAMFRQAIAAKTEMGLKAEEIIRQGGLVPDDVVIAIVRDRLEAEDCQAGYILDGFPRTIPQAEALETFSKLDAAVNVDVPAEKIVKRITSRRTCKACGEIFTTTAIGDTDICPKCGGTLYLRDDDKPDTVANRLVAYEKQTKPLIDFYADKGILINVDGDTPVDEVFAAIQKALLKFKK